MELNPTPAVPSLHDFWLCGFTDAEGCFNSGVRVRANTVTGFRVIVRFLLNQKGAEPILQHIRDLFGYGSVNLRKDTDMVYGYTNDSFKGLESVRNYFLAFPLKTKKLASFNKWNDIYTMVLAKQHLTNEAVDTIRIMSKQINAINHDTRKTGSANPS